MTEEKRPKLTPKKVEGDRFCIKGTELNGGSCGNPCQIDVKDGKILRSRPLQFNKIYDPASFHPWHMEARGQRFDPPMRTLPSPFAYSYKKRVYSPNRVQYPLKRVDWDPNGERNTDKRGLSLYERISWDEATDIIASELKRIGKQYGPEAVFLQADMHGEGKSVHNAHGAPAKLLSMLGGYTIQMRNMDSWEGWAWGAKHVWGMEPLGQCDLSNVMPDITKNTEMILFWGCDPEVTPLGMTGMMPSQLCYWFKELGIECVFISPDLNYAGGVHADKWIPILPGTDAAMQLAIAYVWLQEGTYDKEYVKTHTFGFDEFRAYVLGQEDGEPKTPEWASGKCGVTPAVIRALARQWAKKRTSIAHGNGGGTIRGPYSTENARLEVCLLGMQGLGKPGVHQFKMIEWVGSMAVPKKGAKLAWWVDDVRPPAGTPMDSPQRFITPLSAEAPMDPDSKVGKLTARHPRAPQQMIAKNLLHDALLNPPVEWYGISSFMGPRSDQFNKYQYPAQGCSEIHMIWTDSPCWTTCWNDSNQFIKGIRQPKIEFILAQHPWMENDCLFADIILPVSTKYEEEDLGYDSTCGAYQTYFYENQCIDPIGESVSDYEVVCEVAKKLGLYEVYSGNTPVPERIELSYECNGVTDMPFEEFKEKQYVVLPTDPDWDKRPTALSEFYADPEKHPLDTPSGKLEFFSQGLHKHFPNDEERPPVPHWIENGVTHSERISSERAEKYPLLMMSNHGRWRMHAQNDDNAWCREAPTCKVKGRDGYFYEPCWLNPEEAKKRGIRHGDIVKVFNERGVVLAGAYVTERLRTGTAYMDHGARYDPIIPGEVDRGGAINTITPHNRTSKNVTGMAVSSFLVEVQKVNDEEMDAWKRINPHAFDKPYDEGAGLCLASWLADPSWLWKEEEK